MRGQPPIRRSEYCRGLPHEVNSKAHWLWVRSQVDEARDLFTAGKANIARVQTLRCRLAGYAYIARFEVVLDVIEQDGCLLRASFPERNSWRAALKMGVDVVTQLMKSSRSTEAPMAVQPNVIKGTV